MVLWFSATPIAIGTPSQFPCLLLFVSFVFCLRVFVCACVRAHDALVARGSVW